MTLSPACLALLGLKPCLFQPFFSRKPWKSIGLRWSSTRNPYGRVLFSLPRGQPHEDPDLDVPHQRPGARRGRALPLHALHRQRRQPAETGARAHPLGGVALHRARGDAVGELRLPQPSRGPAGGRALHRRQGQAQEEAGRVRQELRAERASDMDIYIYISMYIIYVYYHVSKYDKKR